MFDLVYLYFLQGPGAGPSSGIPPGANNFDRQSGRHVAA